ncbi:MAG: hypothetical protein KF773_07790 [Deltaproteobacteria bacterium]|nr:hypothetical protein [Deltaproteobacteria bacterium]
MRPATPNTRPSLFRNNLAMRMLRWLMLAGEATQRDFMAEYRRIGAAGSSYGDDFHRYTTHTGTGDVRRVIHKLTAEGTRPRLRWIGGPLPAWLAATPDDELQLGFETMERALVDTNDDHFRDWLGYLRDEIERRAR